MSILKRFLFVTITSSAFVGSAAAQVRKIEYEKYTLPNGLKVILHKDNSVPVVAVTTLYHVGSKNEDTARTGFAHFFEHLLFEGSANIKRGEFVEHVTNAGGGLNANTSQDRTFYYELLPSNQVKLGLWLESERMMHAKIEDIGVNTQREVVKEEKRLRIDNQPYGTRFTELLKRAFPNNPYNWAPIGSMDHLNAAKLDEFMKFYNTYYVPNNCVLSIAGDIDVPAIKKLIEAYFGPIPKGKDVPRPSVKQASLGGEVRDIIQDNVQLPGVFQAYLGPKQQSSDYYAFSLLSSILSDGQSSRFTKALVDEKQVAASASTFPLISEDAGLLITNVIASLGVKPEDLEKEIDIVVNNMKTSLVGDRELQKVKNQVQTNLVNSNATMAGIAERLADYETYFGDAELINTEIEKFNSVTSQQIMDVAKKYLNKENRVVLYYVPKTVAKPKVAAGTPTP